MRRELLIAAGVLVPFGLLVALGFALSAPEPVPPEPGRIALAPPPPAAPTPRPAPAPRTPTTLDIDAGPSRPVAAPAPNWPASLAAPLSAVAPEVHRCFADARERFREPVTTRVRFTPTRDGGFGGVAIESTTQDPWVRACVEDVFEEVRFSPTGAELFAPAEHTFDFDPSGD